MKPPFADVCPPFTEFDVSKMLWSRILATQHSLGGHNVSNESLKNPYRVGLSYLRIAPDTDEHGGDSLRFSLEVLARLPHHYRYREAW